MKTASRPDIYAALGQLLRSRGYTPDPRPALPDQWVNRRNGKRVACLCSPARCTLRLNGGLLATLPLGHTLPWLALRA